MKPKALILKLCRLEALKKQVNVAQMSEIVGHLSDIVYKEVRKGKGSTTLRDLVVLGYNRHTARQKKVKKNK